MLKGFFTVGVWILISRLLGLIRDQLLAAYMGASLLQDAYQVAARLPNMFRQLFGEGAFNAAFVPQFTSLLETHGREEARAFARETLSILICWLVVIAIIGEIFMPSVLKLIAPGFTQDDARYTLSITLARITFPYLVLICAAALVSGVLNGLHKFGAAAAAYVSFNIVGIIAIIYLGPLTPTIAHAAAWGITLSGMVQLFILLRTAYRHGMGLTPCWPLLTSRVKFLLKKMVPGLVGSGVTQMNLAVDTIIGTLLPTGSISVMYFADRINQLPLGVLGAAIGTTLLPILTRHLASGHNNQASLVQSQAIEYALILTFPAVLGLLSLGYPIMTSLFCYGAFTEHDAWLATQSLMAYAVGLPAFILIKVLVPGFFARGDTLTPVKIALFILAVNLCLNILFMRLLSHMGPPLASSVAAMANVLCLAIMLRRKYHALEISYTLWRKILIIFLCSLAMALSLMGVVHFVIGDMAYFHRSVRVILLGLLVTMGISCYAGLIHLAKIGDLRTIFRSISRRESK